MTHPPGQPGDGLGDDRPVGNVADRPVPEPVPDPPVVPDPLVVPAETVPKEMLGTRPVVTAWSPLLCDSREPYAAYPRLLGVHSDEDYGHPYRTTYRGLG